MSTSVDVANPAISIHPVSSPLGDTSHIGQRVQSPQFLECHGLHPRILGTIQEQNDTSMGMGSK